MLPARCRVDDLINFASEVATHHTIADGANRMQAYIGSLISDEYDLEGTATKSKDFDAFFMPPSTNDSHLNNWVPREDSLRESDQQTCSYATKAASRGVGHLRTNTDEG